MRLKNVSIDLLRLKLPLLAVDSNFEAFSLMLNLIILMIMLDHYTNQITEDELEEFKKIYLQDYGRVLDDQKALEIATNTLAMVKTVYGKSPLVK